VTGVTVVRLSVSAVGAVTSAEVIKSAGPTRHHALLDRVAVEILSCPGLLKGTGAEYTRDVPYFWRLD
jgi:hypothetical protein